MSTEQGVPLVGDAGARRNKLLAGGVLLALGVVGAVLTPRYGFMAGLGAAIFGISGLSVLLAGLGFSGRGPCPSCGAEVRDVPKDAEAIRCSGCGQYCLARAAHLFPTPPDHVATHGVYAVTVEPGTQPDFHGRCAACGQPATRTLPRELSATVVGAPGVARVVRQWTIDVAVCDAHAAPDSLGNPQGVTSYQKELQVAAYATWRAMTGRG